MNTYTNLHYHLIFRTLDGAPLLTPSHGSDLCRYVNGIVKTRQGMLVDTAAMPEHIHLLLGLHPSVALADMVRDIKAISSKWLNQTYNRRGWFRWQPGYGAFTVSESQITKVRKFFLRQHQHHQQLTSEEEFVRFVERHGFEYDTGPAERRRHTYAWSRIHVVFSTKLRMALIPETMQDDLFQKIGQLATQQRAELVEAGGIADHVHLVLATDRTIRLADLVKSIKNESTYWLRDCLGEKSMFAWQRGYGAFTVSLSELPVVRRYVQAQKEHHREISFEDEFRKLLTGHGLALQK